MREGSCRPALDDQREMKGPRRSSGLRAARIGQRRIEYGRTEFAVISHATNWFRPHAAGLVYTPASSRHRSVSAPGVPETC